MALPSGYTELQWIESTGEQYFKTGIFPTENTSIEVEVSGWPPSQGTSALFGAQSSSSDRFDLFITSDGLYRSYWGGSGSVTFDASVSCENDVLVVRNKADISIGAATLSNSARTFTCAAELYLFAHNNNGSSSRRSSLRAKRWYIRENGALTREYIPCVNRSGVVGLYDNVSGSFDGSASDTAFVAGPLSGPVGCRTLLDGVDYQIKSGSVMLDSVAYTVEQGKVMVEGSVRDIYFSRGTPVSDLSIESTVKINVNGVAKDFIVVHHGKPSSLYDDSCDGTWLLMKDCYSKPYWDDYSKIYNNSYIHTYLNSTFLNLIDGDVQSLIKTVKIPYWAGSNLIKSGANGLPAQVFLLSAYEVGYKTSDEEYIPVDGAKLSYFGSGTGTAAQNKRIAYYSGSKISWWLRSPKTSTATDADDPVWYVGTGGGIAYRTAYTFNSIGARPALILANDALVDDEFNLLPV